MTGHHHFTALSAALLFVCCFGRILAADYAMEGESYSLTCVPDSEPTEVLYWLINGVGEAYETGKTYDTVSVGDDGTLTFKEVTVDHEGNHLCVTRRQEKISGHHVAMKVRLLPPTDLWNEVYKSQFITGLVAALLCAFVFTAGCLVFKYRYKEPKSVLLNGSGEEGGHYNPALEVDGDHQGASTKM